MTPELLAMLGGGVSGFVMKMIAAQADNQARLFERMIARQTIADESADKAAARGGVYMRRAITAAVIFAIVIAPFVFAFTDIGVSIQSESKGFLGPIQASRMVHCTGVCDTTRDPPNSFSHRRVLLWFLPSQITNNIMYGRKTKNAGKGSCGERGGKKGK